MAFSLILIGFIFLMYGISKKIRFNKNKTNTKNLSSWIIITISSLLLILGFILTLNNSTTNNSTSDSKASADSEEEVSEELQELRYVRELAIIEVESEAEILATKFDIDYDGDSSLLHEATSIDAVEEKKQELLVAIKEKEKELIESNKHIGMLEKVSELIDTGEAYDSGDYIQGDVTKGTYAFISFTDSGGYYSESDVSGNIIDNANFDSFGYVTVHEKGNLSTDGFLVNVNSLDKLKVSGAKELWEIVNNIENYNESGYYKVGQDIEAGSYVLTSIGDAYVSLNSGVVGNNDIIDNNNFNGQWRISVSNGQYLEISRAEFSKE